MRMTENRIDTEKIQEQEWYRQLLAGEENAVEKISGAWLRRIVDMAGGYKSERVYLEDLVQEGSLALLMALHSYLGKTDTQDLEEKLTEAVTAAMEEFAGEETGEQQQEEAILAKVTLLYEARELLTEQQGMPPTVRELAEYTRMDQEEITDILQIMEKAKERS
jgi:RNA polymerase primary sigma factor